MPVRVICFYQPGCMGFIEQSPINREVEKKMDVTIEEIVEQLEATLKKYP